MTKTAKDGPIDPSRLLNELWKSYSKDEKGVEGLFFVDVKGDPQNAKYGKPDKYATVKYERWTNGVLGLPGWRIRESRHEFREREVTLVPIGSRPGSAYDRWLRVEDAPVDVELASVLENESVDGLAPLLQARGVLSQQLAEDPSNGELWLEAGRIEAQIQERSGAGSNGEAVLRDFYTRALECVPGDGRLLDCYIKYVGNGRSVALRKIVRDHAEKPELWVKYLSACVSETKDRDVFEVVELLLREHAVMDLFRAQAARRSTAAGRQAMDAVYVAMLAYVSRLYWDAGYPAQAVGLFQASIEYSVLGEPDDNRFAKFWSSEAARVGEPGAKGRKRWNPSDPVASLGSDTLFAIRSVDRAATTEPDRVVLYDDVAEWLAPVHTSSGRAQLLWAFMNCLGASTPDWVMHDASVLLLPFIRDDAALAECRRRVLAQCRSAAGIDDTFWVWALEHIHSLSVSGPTPARLFSHPVEADKQFTKFAKGLLKEEHHRNSPRLWGAYARLGPKSAPAVFQSAISMIPGASIDASLALWVEWAAFCAQRDCQPDAKLLSFLRQLLGPGDFAASLDALERSETVTTAEAALARFFVAVHTLWPPTLEHMYAALKSYWAAAHNSAYWSGLILICDVLAVLVSSRSPLCQPRLLREHLATGVRAVDAHGTVHPGILARLAQFEHRFGPSLSSRLQLPRQNTVNSYLSWLYYQLYYHSGDSSPVATIREALQTIPEPCSRLALLYLSKTDRARVPLRSAVRAFHTSSLARLLRDLHPDDHVVDDVVARYSLDLSRSYDLHL